MAAGDFKFYLSGGATNTDCDASLGGVQSTTGIAEQTIAWTSTSMTGVTLVSANGNIIGASPADQGVLIFQITDTIDTLAWAPPGLMSGYVYQSVAVDGTYTITADPATGYTGSVTVTVDSSLLPASNETQDITITDPSRNLFADITATDSRDGTIEHRGLYLVNEGAQIETVEIAVVQDYSAARLEFAFAPEGVDDEMETLTNEDTAPAGVSWQSPTLALPLSIELDAASYIGVWIRRVVDPINRNSAVPDTAIIRLSV